MENIVNALCKQAQIFKEESVKKTYMVVFSHSKFVQSTNSQNLKKGMVIIWKDLTLTEKY